MKVSDAGIELIKEFEGCKLTAYRDVAGILTIGYGHTGFDVKSGMKITEEQANALLRRDVVVAEKCLNACLDVPVTQSQYDALASLVFNIGCGAFRKSTLLRKLNDGDDVSAAQEFQRWNRSKGVELAGLTRRRQAEMEMFLA